MEDKEHKDKKGKEALKEAYNKLKEKQNLPSFEAIHKDFEIENIESDEDILREIIKEMHSTIDFYSRILENLIQPDSKLCDMREAGNLTKEDQATITELYRLCMLLNRSLLLVDLDYEENDAAKTITDTHRDWQDVKKQLKIILTKMRDTWMEQSKKETYGGYYG
jgi:Ser/Thr protein kinase RdoA (MazF antagonist)